MTAIEDFVSTMRGLSFANVFNPYSDHCAVYDHVGAARKRAKALTEILTAAVGGGVHSIWIGRDLGYRGGRRTGLALTDDVHVSAHAARWGIRIDRCTKGQAVKERTAAFAWTVLERIDLPVFLWNVFPFHPHDPGQPFTNRSHCARERRAGEEILAELLALLRPSRIVAVGGDAARSAARIAPLLITQVRHPSYGGQSEFLNQMEIIYRLGRPHRSGTPDLFEAPAEGR
jgi:uracil-DNA glycosylase